MFKLQGTYGTEPSNDDVQSLDPLVGTTISEIMSLSKKEVADYDLLADAPVSVSLAGLTGVNVLVVKVVDGRKIRLRMTSADGATQAVPVDTALIHITRSVPLTALDLTRVAGVDTTVRIFLGQSS